MPTEFVPLTAPIQLVPKEFRILQAQLAAQFVAAEACFNEPHSTARNLLRQCGIEEALVPKQHQEQLEQSAALDVLYPPKEAE